MFELKKSKEVSELIAATMSNSGVSGPELAIAHIRLGMLLGKQMNFCAEETTVVALLRGGIFFAEGIYFALGCKFEVYNPKAHNFKRPKTKNVIIVDSVINTGNTVAEILESDMYLACCVVNEKAVEKFDKQLFTVRVSKNSFVGSNVREQSGNSGPDTTMRLFNQL